MPRRRRIIRSRCSVVVLRVSRSGFYAWASRGPSARVQQDARLIAQLRLAHADSRQTYGRPRLCRALRDRGIAVSGKRVARLMRAAGLRARGRRRFIVTTDSRHNFAIAPNRVRRRFRPRRLNRVWAADMTACRLQHGWCYLAVVLDLASRRVIGWAAQRTPAPDLVDRGAHARAATVPTVRHDCCITLIAASLHASARFRVAADALSESRRA